jgi:hypothetical protein
MRSAQASARCAECESYRLVAGTCEVCGWNDPDYEPVELPELTEGEIAERLAEPCTPSSDISTFISPCKPKAFGSRRSPLQETSRAMVRNV